MSRSITHLFCRRLSLCVFPIQPGAYDDVVKDIDAIMHMASSLRLDIENPMDVINATVNQYLGLLESVKKYG